MFSAPLARQGRKEPAETPFGIFTYEMHENYAQFQSALAMLDRMYEDLDLGVTYREMKRAQT